MADVHDLDRAARNKLAIRSLIETVWSGGDLSALERFWTSDCLNHAAAAPDNRGLAALRRYHESFLPVMSALAPLRFELIRQVAEGDFVSTHIMAHCQHNRPVLGHEPTGRKLSWATIRIDRIEDGRIAEHWSVADTAGLLAQLQP